MMFWNKDTYEKTDVMPESLFATAVHSYLKDRLKSRVYVAAEGNSLYVHIYNEENVDYKRTFEGLDDIIKGSMKASEIATICVSEFRQKVMDTFFK